MKRWMMMLIGATSAQGVFADPSAYICTVEKSAGLHYDGQTKAWWPRAFAPGKQYMLRKLTEENLKEHKHRMLQNLDLTKPNWAFWDSKLLVASCIEDTSIVKFSELMCRPIIAMVDFDKDSRRFEVSHHGAYVEQGFWRQLQLEDSEQYKQGLINKHGGDADHPDDVFVEVGTCSPDR
ncbi:hypothetical protein [Chromobacterium sp. ATCC 53434]|uniref:hypothetical protein n=1 Tax=Chromobacterium sp. (strain ATCC 53434 / SC 14030) TaxID=2059672 RepID=UPI0013052DEB|nr:hypothetical protein [Chromobacterium sp. ATCC 53434]